MAIVFDHYETERIRAQAYDLLRRSDSLGEVPTPLDRLMAAAGIVTVAPLTELSAVPDGLARRLRRLKNKVLGALAVREKVIILDQDQSRAKARFVKGHEFGHQVLAGHPEAYYTDDATTLSPAVADLLEAEANLFSAELLFQIHQFRDEAASYRLGLGAPIDLAQRYETSIHSAIRRYVESSPRACALLVIGKFPVHPQGVASLKVLEHFESARFRIRYGNASSVFPGTLAIAGSELGAAAQEALSALDIYSQIEGKMTTAVGGELSTFRFEVVSNTYRSFALLAPDRRLDLGRRTLVVARQAPDLRSA